MKLVVRVIGAVAALGFVALLPPKAAADEAGSEGARDALAVTGRRSSDLRVRIVYSQDHAIVADGSYRLTDAIPVELLVEQSRGSTDPVVLSLMVDRCGGAADKAKRCDAVDLAHRWTVADTQNQLAWVALATVLADRNDLDAARTAFRRAADASLWHEYYPEVGRLLAVAAPKGRDAKQEAAVLLAVLSRSFVHLPSGHYLTIGQRCKDLDLRDACGRILETMSRNAQSSMSLDIATAFAVARSVLPPATVATMRQRSDAMQWATLENAKRILDEPGDEAEARVVVSYLQALVASNEIETLRRFLEERRLAESDAARSYVATLSSEQIARRSHPDGKAASSAL